VSGYRDAAYVASLSEFGTPRALPCSGGWLLERAVPGASRLDLMGPYPVFTCADWPALPEDVERVEDAVSVVLVADALAEVDAGVLRAAFPDRVVPFKRHHVCHLERPRSLPAHHRRHVRRASAAVEVDVCARPAEHLADWTRLYGALADRHRLTGIRAFSRTAFARQLAAPGLLAVRAVRDEQTIGMALWFQDGPDAWYHLAAYSPAGYAVSASYGLFAVALDVLRDRGVLRVDLGGSAGASSREDGLTRFKRGWADDERVAHLCGRILDHRAYERLSGRREGEWFPAYRSSDRDLAVR
jgi:hypothetical protein